MEKLLLIDECGEVTQTNIDESVTDIATPYVEAVQAGVFDVVRYNQKTGLFEWLNVKGEFVPVETVS
jgi:hypothetical protein